MDFTDADLSVADDVSITLDLRTPGASPIAGTDDGLIRADHLSALLSDFVFTTVNGSLAEDDVVFTGAFEATALFPGRSAPFTLGGARLKLSWADINDPLGVRVSADTGVGQELIQFLDARVEDLVDGIAAIAPLLDNVAGIDVLGAKLPLINKSLGEILGGDTQPVVHAGTDIDEVTAVEMVDSNLEFTVSLVEQSSQSEGVMAGDTVVYRGAAGDELTGTIGEVGIGFLTVRVDGIANPEPDRNDPFFQIFRGGMLGDQLRASLGGLFNLGSLDVEIPTFQELVRNLADLIGLNPDALGLQVVTGVDGGRAIQITFPFDLDPIEFDTDLDLDLGLDGLAFSASVEPSITITPSLFISVGLRLDSNVDLADRFYFVENPDPELLLHVDARLDDLEIFEKLGILGVKLEESGDNDGIVLSGSLGLNLVDPGAGAQDDERITFAELTSSALGDVFHFEMDLDLDIEGLNLTPVVSGGFNLGLAPIPIALDGSGPGTPGHLPDTVAEIDDFVANLVQNLLPPGFDLSEYLNFENLAAQGLLVLLQQLRDWLDSFRDSSAFNTAIPFTKKTLGDVADLGSAFFDTVVGDLDNPRLVATSLAPKDGRLSDDVQITLRVNETDVDVNIPAAQTQDNAGPDDLADDLNAALVVALQGAGLSGALNAEISQGLVMIAAAGDDVDSLQVPSGNAALGFADDLIAEAVGFSSVQEFIDGLTARLAGAVGADYDAATNVLTFDLSFDKTLADTTLPIDFSADLGSLAEVTSQSTLNVSANAGGRLTLGVDLSDLTSGFQLQNSIQLATLNGGLGLMLPSDSPQPVADVRITLRQGGAPVDVDIPDTATTLDQVLMAIANASPLLDAQIAPDGQSLLLIDSSTGSGTFTVSGLNGSFAAIDLGIVGTDVDNDGQILGKALHGQMESGRFFIDATNANFNASASLASSDIDAAARFGFAGVAIEDGTSSVLVDLNVALADPGTDAPDGRITFDELFGALGSDIDSLVPPGQRNLSGSAQFDLPIRLEPPDFDPGTNPALIVSWPDLFDPNTLSADIDPDFDLLAALENFAVTRILDAMRQVHATVESVETQAIFDQELPLIDRSIAELLDISGKLNRVIDRVEDDQPRTIEAFRISLVDAVKAEVGDLLPDLSLSFADQSFDLDLGFDAGFHQSLPFNLDLVDLNLSGANLISAETSGMLAVDADAAVDLGLSFDLSDPLNPKVFIKESTARPLAAISATVGGAGLDMDVNVLGLELLVRNGSAAMNGSWTLGLVEDLVDHQYELLPNLELNAGLITSTLNGNATASLEVFFPTPADPIGTFGLNVPDLRAALQNPGPTTINLSGPDVDDLVNQFLADIRNNLTGLVTRWDDLLNLLIDALDGEVFGIQIPLVGDKLSDAASFLKDLRDQVQGGIENLGSAPVDAVRDALFDVLGPPGLNWLKDVSGDGLLTPADDIPFTADADMVQFDIALHQDLTALNVPLDFDIGLPALGLDVDGDVRVRASFDLDIGFGFSRDDGPYIETSVVDELVIRLLADVPGLSATGNLAFLQLDVQDNPSAPSFFDGTFTVDLIDPNLLMGRQRLSLSDFQSVAFSDVVSASVDATADVNLNLVASFGGRAAFPSLHGDFNLDWSFTGADPRAGPANEPLIAFNNLQLDAGEFLSDLFGSTLRSVQQILDPLDPVIQVLTFKLPVIDLSLVEMAQRFGNSTLQFIAAAVDIIQLVQSIPVFNGSILIDLGSFDLAGTDVRTLSDLSNVVPNTLSTGSPKTQLAALDAQAANFLNQAETVDGGGFAFPIFNDPTKAFGLFMGKDVDLVLFDMAPLKLELGKTFSIPIFPPLYAEITGRAGVEADFAFGYDTVGLRRLAASGFSDFAAVADGFFVSDRGNADGTGENVAELVFSGLVSIAGVVDLAVVRGGIEGGIEVTIDMNLNDPDGNGRVRLDEIVDNFLRGPHCLFDTSGMLDVFLQPFLKFGIKLPVVGFKTLFEVDLPGFRETLLDFNLACGDVPAVVPVLGSVDQGVLTLNMGPRAADRLEVDTDDDDESFTISPGVLSNEVFVDAFGFRQQFNGVTSIVGDGGQGDDTINVKPGISVPVDLRGGPGDDALTASAGPATLHGDEGMDVLIGGPAADMLFGGDSDDRIVGNGGNDLLDGGKGRDVLEGGNGDDVINGGFGIDNISGGDGADTIDGGFDPDQINAGPGADVVDGGIGNDTIEGLDGDDVINGGFGADTIIAGPGNDVVDGGPENDMVLGGEGDDNIVGGLGDDTLDGEEGDDTIDAGAGDDTVRGDDGNDDITAGLGSDTVFGGAGNDRIDGDGDDDELFGAAGDDVLIGGAANDLVDGGDGNDVLWGDQEAHDRAALLAAFITPPQFATAELANPTGFNPPLITPALLSDAAGLASVSGGAGDGRDRLEGRDGNDWLLGNGGNDDLNGGIGTDFADGGSGNDTVRGGPDEDVLLGGPNDDVLRGDSGIDQLYGDDWSESDSGHGADNLFGDAGDAQDNQAGQRLWGGGGPDTLWAFAPTTDPVSEAAQVGDEMHGGGGSDLVEGQDGHDQIFGGSEIDIIVLDTRATYTRLGDTIDGHFHNSPQQTTADTNDTDILRIDGTSDDDTIRLSETDVAITGSLDGPTDGRLGAGSPADFTLSLDGSAPVALSIAHDDTNVSLDDLIDDINTALPAALANARLAPGAILARRFGKSVSLSTNGAGRGASLLISNTNATSRDQLGFADDQAGVALLEVQITTRQNAVVTNDSTVLALWRDHAGEPLIEQFRIAGLNGIDDLGFVSGPDAVDVSALLNRSDDFIGVLDGGPQDDRLSGTAGRDRLDGGTGSDLLFGFGGDDRLFGDGGSGSVLDQDVLFAGSGNDDLIGGQGTNDLFAWSLDPDDDLDVDTIVQFGIFTDSAGDLVDDDQNGTLSLEDTGLNRMLGGPNDDRLFGGTGLDFLFGNGGSDELFTVDGTPFEDLDGQLGGDAWKQYARATDKVWFVGATNADDVISVDFVTEPGLLVDRHVVTRLTNNNGNFTFDLQVRLDFNATDNDGKLIWDPSELLLDLAAIQDADAAQRQLFFDELLLNGALLPEEGDFLAIIIDAMDGEDVITVGSTVQSTVWVDAGAGDDRVEILAGNAILIDQTERPLRNDVADRAFDLQSAVDPTSTPAPFDQNVTFTGLTIDNAADVDWYTFAVTDTTAAELSLSSLSVTDGLSMQIYDAAIEGLALADGTFIAPVLAARDGAEFGVTPNDTLADAFVLSDIRTIARVVGATLHDAGDVDFYGFTLDAGDEDSSPSVKLRSISAGSALVLELFDAAANAVGTIDVDDDLLVADLSGLNPGDYVLKVSGQTAARYELLPVIGPLGVAVSDLASTTSEPLDLSALSGDTTHWLEVASPNLVPTIYDMAFGVPAGIGAPLSGPINLATRQDAVRQDVILGRAGNDALAGGSGRDWIFGGPGNDVLSGGPDQQSDDLLFGQGGDDAFQVVPDGLPFIKGSDKTLVPTLSDQFHGGPGNDHVLFLGGDRDAAGQPVPDHVAIRYNTILHRYEVGALVWDTANQRFVTSSAPAVLRAPQQAPADGKIGSDLAFRLVVDGGSQVAMSVLANTDPQRRFEDLIADLNAAIDAAGVTGSVIAGQDDGHITFATPAFGPTASIEIRFDANDPSSTLLGFDGQLSAIATGTDNAFLKHFAFYQANDVEGTIIDTRAGSDEVQGDPGYVFPAPDGSIGGGSEWGIDPGDFQQRGVISALRILGGDHSDLLFGGALNDLIDGGNGDDFIFGNTGDDDLIGGGGSDLIAGNDEKRPDRFEVVTRGGSAGRNDDLVFAAELPLINTSLQQATLIDGLNFHTGDEADWYFVRTPAALRQYGSAGLATLNRDMIRIKDVPGSNGLDFLVFAAEDTDPSAGLALAPVAEPIGVPEFFLIQVLNTGAVLLDYQITFDLNLGRSTDVPANEAAFMIDADADTFRRVVIPLGDVNGDMNQPNGGPDVIAALQDDAGDIADLFAVSTSMAQHPADMTRPTFARIYFGDGTLAQNQTLDTNAVTLRLPAPVHTISAWGARSVFANPGDYNDDGIDDVAIAVTLVEDPQLGGNRQFTAAGVYVLFGRTNWPALVDVVDDADVVIADDFGQGGMLRVDNAGDVDGDGIDDLIVGHAPLDPAVAGTAHLFFGRTNWPTTAMLRADFDDAQGTASLDGFTIDNSNPGAAAGQWDLSVGRSNLANHSQPHSLYFGTGETPDGGGNYDVGDQTAGRVDSPVIDLSALGTDDALLSFRYLLETNDPFRPNADQDTATVLSSVDGAPFGPVASNLDLLIDPVDRWVRVALRLDDLALSGAQATLRFEFSTLDASDNDFEGWYIDDVVVRPVLSLSDADVTITRNSPGDGFGAAVAGIGDFTGDGIDDLAVLGEADAAAAGPGSAYVFAGRDAQNPWPAALNDPDNEATFVLTHTAPLAGYDVRAAGNANGDNRFDLIVTGPRDPIEEIAGFETSFLVPGSANPALGSGVAAHSLTALGDVNGDSFDDIGASVFELGFSFFLGLPIFDEHQVGHVYFGQSNGPDLTVPDLVLESAAPQYIPLLSTASIRVPRSHAFGFVGDLNKDGTFDFAMADDQVGALHVYRGQALAVAPPLAVGRLPEQFFAYELGTPLVNPAVPTPGVDLHDTGASLSDAFALLGVDPGGLFSGVLADARSLGDINGDGFTDLQIGSPTLSYIVFGPVRLDGQIPVTDVATIAVDTDLVGKIASRNGDVNGDGIDDLAFVRDSGFQELTVSIVFGGGDLPQFLDDPVALSDRQLVISIENPIAIADPFDVVMLDWDGDGFDDVWVQPGKDESDHSVDIGRLYSGRRIAQSATTDVDVLAARLLRITPDLTTRDDEMAAIYGPNWSSLGLNASRGGDVESTAVGDVNGDGLADLLIFASDFLNITLVGPDRRVDFGRAYLLLGRAQQPPSGELALLDADAIYQDYELTVAALRDLNADGFDDFAFSREEEDSFTGFGAVVVLHGSSDPSGFNGRRVGTTLTGDQTISRFAPGQLPPGFAAAGFITATAGDFDGDGKGDLAVGEFFSVIANAPGNTISFDDRGRVFVFFSIDDRPTDLVLADADLVLDGENELDFFGRMPTTPGMDLDGDGFDDLLATAINANTVIDGSLVPAAGKIYVIHGSPAPQALPAQIQPLTNLTVTGSGAFLVDRATGQPEDFDLSLSDGQAEQWYYFTTLGDGQSGNHIQLTPATEPSRTDVLNTRDGTFRQSSQTHRPEPVSTQLFAGDGLISILEFDLSRFLPYMDDLAYLQDAKLRLEVTGTGLSATDVLRVSMLDEEADGLINANDATAAATELMQFNLAAVPDDASGSSAVLELDVLATLRDVLASGQTRIALRLELVDPLSTGMVHINRASSGGQTELSVTTRQDDGVLADLLNSDAGLLQSGRALIDMQPLPAGTYYLRVFNPFSTDQTDFTVSFMPPGAGKTHGESDRDDARGGEGDDFLFGNEDLDALSGEGGDDTFTGELIEFRDATTNETTTVLTTSDPQHSRSTGSGPVVKEADIRDAGLRVAVGAALGFPITTSHEGLPIVSQDIFETDLRSLVRLDAVDRGVRDIEALSLATNLRELFLAGNDITDISPLVPGLGGTTGTPRLVHLTLDGNQIDDLSALANLTQLKRLSLDHNPLTDIAPLAALNDLDLLSIDGRPALLARLPGEGFSTGFDRLRQFALPSLDARAFGAAIAATDEWLVVGAPDTIVAGNALAGAVHVYDRATGELLQTIENPDPTVDTGFGTAVAAVGHNVLIGVPFGVVSSIAAAGRVYLYDGATGQQLNEISNPNPDPTPNVFDFFGIWVGFLGDNLLVGQVGGAAAVYAFDPDTGDEVLRINDPRPGVGKFGFVATIGTDVLVGAPFDDTDGTNAGIVYRFDGTTGQQVYTLRNPDPNTDDLFGQTLAVSGDRIVVGAPTSNPGGGPDGGAVHAFDAGTGQHLITIDNPHPSQDDQFGMALAAFGQTILVGSPGEDTDGMTDSGAAYLFDAVTGDLLATLQSPAPTLNDVFGIAVAATGRDLYVGADQMDHHGISDAGSVYLFDGRLLADPSPLVALDDLRWLSLAHNQIDDIGPLSTLAALDYLYLHDNRVADITALLGSTASLITLDANPLNSEALDVLLGQLANTLGAPPTFTPNPNGPALDSIGPQGTAQDTPFMLDVAPLGTFGGALLFDGDDDQVVLPAGLLNGLTNVTTEFWLNTTKTGIQSVLSGAGAAGSTNEYQLFINSSHTFQLFSHGFPAVTWDITSSFIADGEWRHFAIVTDASTAEATLYIDAMSQGPMPVNASPLNVDFLFIGQDQDSVGGSFDPNQALTGTLDELLIWNVARTAQEIQSDRMGLFVPNDPALAAYYPFDEPSGNTALDASGNGHDGLLGSGVASAEPQRVADADLRAILAHVDADGDSSFYTAQSDDPMVQVAISSTQLTATPDPGFTGTVSITVAAQDGPSGPGDWRGRAATRVFDLHVGVGAIYGTKWHDLDSDGVQDIGEPPLEDWTIYVDQNRNSRLDAGENSTTTDANGAYALTDLPFGFHTIAEVPQAAWAATTPIDVFVADFAAGAAQGFTSTGTMDQWHLSTLRSVDAGHSPSHGFYFGDDATSEYANNAQGTLTSPLIDLSDETGPLFLEFAHHLDLPFDMAEIFRAEFTDNIGRSTADGFAGTGIWHVSTGRSATPGHSTPHSFYYGANEGPSGGGKYVPNAGSSVLTSPMIDLSGLGGTIQLRFEHLLGTGFPQNDVANVIVRQGASTTTIAADVSSTSNQFQTMLRDLSAFAGQQIQIEFEFIAGNTFVQGEGWYIDDVVVLAENQDAVSIDILHTSGTTTLADNTTLNNLVPTFGSGDLRTLMFDISAFTGDQIQVQFNFNADAAATAEGWHVDDVAIVSGARTRTVNVGVGGAPSIITGIDFGNFLVVDAGPDQAVSEGDTVMLNAVVNDPNPSNGANLDHRWQVQSTNNQVIADGFNPAFGFTPVDNGTYTVTLTITDQDDGGATYTEVVEVVVNNIAPTVDLGLDQSVNEGDAVSFAAPVFTDPGADVWTLDWHIVDLATNSAVETFTGPGFVFTPTDDGTFQVNLTVTDDDGDVGSGSVLVNVANVLPAVVLTPPIGVFEGDLVSIAHTITDPGSDAHDLLWTVNADNGQSLTSTSSNFRFVATDDGQYTVTLTATESAQDDPTALGSQTIVFTVGNIAPTLSVPDDFTTNEGDFVLVIGLIADPGTADDHTVLWEAVRDDTGLIVASSTDSQIGFVVDNEGTYTLTFTVDDGADAVGTDVILTVQNVAPSAAISFDAGGVGPGSIEGTLVQLSAIVADAGTLDLVTLDWQVMYRNAVFANGSGASLSFTPRDDGDYDVVLTADDGTNATLVPLTISVANAAPAVDLGPAALSVNEGDLVSLTAAFIDPGSDDTHSLSWQVFADNGQTVSGGAGPVFDFTPNDDGTYVVQLTVTDDELAQGSDTLTVTALNVAPQVNVASSSPTPAPRQAVRFNGTFADPGDDTWRGRVDFGDGSKLPVLLLADKTYTFTHVYATAGDFTVTMTLTDDNGGSTSDALLVTVGDAGTAPTVTQVLVRGSSWSIGDFPVSVGSAAQFESLRWSNVDQIVIRFSEDVMIPAGAIQLSGVLGPDGVLDANVDYAFTLTTGIGTGGEFEAVLTVAAPFAADKLLLKLDGTTAATITSVGGIRLDGEWTDAASVFPSGDGAAGGDLRLRLNSLPGDADGDGSVGDVDLSIVLFNFGKSPPADLRADLDGDLAASDPDLGILLSFFGRNLPAGTPAAPVNVQAPEASITVSALGDSVALFAARPAVIEPDASETNRRDRGGQVRADRPRDLILDRQHRKPRSSRWRLAAAHFTASTEGIRSFPRRHLIAQRAVQAHLQCRHRIVDVLVLARADEHGRDVRVRQDPGHGQAHHWHAQRLCLGAQVFNDTEVVFVEIDVRVRRTDVKSRSLGKLVSLFRGRVFAGQEAGRQRAVGRDGDLLLGAARQQVGFG